MIVAKDDQRIWSKRYNFYGENVTIFLFSVRKDLPEEHSDGIKRNERLRRRNR